MKKPKRLAHEMILILTLKCIGLFCLWWFCFSFPLRPHLTMQDHFVHILGD